MTYLLKDYTTVREIWNKSGRDYLLKGDYPFAPKISRVVGIYCLSKDKLGYDSDRLNAKLRFNVLSFTYRNYELVPTATAAKTRGFA